jgi:large subunit ribosomal protein L25
MKSMIRLLIHPFQHSGYLRIWRYMKLKISPRTGDKKSEAKRLRREGNIPACIYGRGKSSETISVPSNEFASLLRQVEPGRLSTTVFELEQDKEKGRKVIIKDIQYEPTNYAVVHLDFEELIEGAKINVKVPIECVGVVDCVGVKLGGVLRQVIRNIRVRCLTQDLPTFFQVDVRNLAHGEVKRLKDLEIPDTVRPLADLNEVAVIIAKR